jgi:hypothetical protein
MAHPTLLTASQSLPCAVYLCPGQLLVGIGKTCALTDIGKYFLFIRRLGPGLAVPPSAPWTRLHRPVHDGPVPWS